MKGNLQIGAGREHLPVCRRNKGILSEMERIR